MRITQYRYRYGTEKGGVKVMQRSTHQPTVPCPDCEGTKRGPDGKACLTCNAIGYLLTGDPRARQVGRVK